MSLITTLLELTFPILLKALKEIGDAKIAGEELSPMQLKTAYLGLVAIETHFEDIVASTDNTFDDAALAELQALIEDTLQEANIPLPEVPEFE